MKALHLTIAAAAAGLLLAAGSPASAATLAPPSPAPTGIDSFEGAVEPVHYRPRARRYYGGGPVINFGLSPYGYGYGAPYYYGRPYGYGYSPYRYGYGGYPYGGYPYGGYGYGPSFGFGFRLN